MSTKHSQGLAKLKIDTDKNNITIIRPPLSPTRPTSTNSSSLYSPKRLLNLISPKNKSLNRKGNITIAGKHDPEAEHTIRCMFCGGPKCPRCSEHAHMGGKDQAITGLHSNWITDDICAMQRPSTKLMKKYHILEQFQSKNIKAIFNLTIPGEHPLCGDGNEMESGFPYLPEDFMKQGIMHYNYGWEDMTTPSIDRMKDIVKVAIGILISGGKISIHCHAGYGRTGILIASILIVMNHFQSTMKYSDVIHYIREKRPGSIQTKTQNAFVESFSNEITQQTKVYDVVNHNNTNHTTITNGNNNSNHNNNANNDEVNDKSYFYRPKFIEFVDFQHLFIYGENSIKMRWIPRPIYYSIAIMMVIAKANAKLVASSLTGVVFTNTDDVDENSNFERLAIKKEKTSEGEQEETSKKKINYSEWGLEDELSLNEYKECANINDWSYWEDKLEQSTIRPDSTDPRQFCQLFYDWVTSLSEPILDPGQIFTNRKEETNIGILGTAPLAIRKTIELILDMLRMLHGQVSPVLMRRVYIRMGVALLQMNSLSNHLMNGRNLNKNLNKNLLFVEIPTCSDTTNDDDDTRSENENDSKKTNEKSLNIPQQLKLVHNFMEKLVTNYDASEFSKHNILKVNSPKRSPHYHHQHRHIKLPVESTSDKQSTLITTIPDSDSSKTENKIK